MFPRARPAMLREQHIIDMPVADYMNARQQAFFRQRLEGQRRKVMQQLRRAVSPIRDRDQANSQAGAVPLRDAVQDQLRDTTARHYSRTLAAIDRAIARIDRGEFGFDDTGTPVGIRELMLDPTNG